MNESPNIKISLVIYLEKMTPTRFLVFLYPAILFLVSCGEKVPESGNGNTTAEERDSSHSAYEIVQTTPHDTSASTQGLLLHEGVYYESTGGYGSSTLRRVDPKSGKTLKRRNLPVWLFGEGLALRGDKLYQLEWKSGQGFIYDRETFERIGDFHYPGEGWGLTWDGEYFILSDGTAFLRFFEPDSFNLVRSVKVHNHLGAIDRLNELEFVEGKIFANRWFSDELLVINPASGLVEKTLNLTALERPRPRDPESVLNGIAYDPKTRLLHVTGKRWPRIYVLRIQE